MHSESKGGKRKKQENGCNNQLESFLCALNIVRKQMRWRKKKDKSVFSPINGNCSLRTTSVHALLDQQGQHL